MDLEATSAFQTSFLGEGILVKKKASSGSVSEDPKTKATLVQKIQELNLETSSGLGKSLLAIEDDIMDFSFSADLQVVAISSVSKTVRILKTNQDGTPAVSIYQDVFSGIQVDYFSLKTVSLGSGIYAVVISITTKDKLSLIRYVRITGSAPQVFNSAPDSTPRAKLSVEVMQSGSNSD